MYVQRLPLITDFFSCGALRKRCDSSSNEDIKVQPKLDHKQVLMEVQPYFRVCAVVLGFDLLGMHHVEFSKTTTISQ